jgi:hypothetical protein
MKNPETLATLDTQNEGAIKNEQPRDTGYTGHTKHSTKVQSRMNNPETLATLDTQDTGQRSNQE